jgi:hypothetical protein
MLLIVARDAQVLPPAMPGAETQDGGRHERRCAVQHQQVGGGKDRKRDCEDIERHPVP